MNQASASTYDYIFCGGGASASLLLLAMQNGGLLHDKRVLIIDKESKTRRDKTFCFWSQQHDSIETTLHELISHSWQSVILPGNVETSLAPFRYNHISSLDLYQKIDNLANKCGWERFSGNVTGIEKSETGYTVHEESTVFHGKLVFDSRNPNFLASAGGQTHLFQSFVGWHIKLPEGSACSKSFRFMDFDIDQSRFTQFVYTLPYSDGTILVELTRFGNEVIEHDEAESLLHDYICRKLGAYLRVDKEFGCIPMSTAPLDVSSDVGVIQLGARNYSIKSSTGYAFKNMYHHAERIVESLQRGESPAKHNQNHSTAHAGRFAFFDSLLLDILKKEPKEGKRIFESLFKHTSIPTIMNFLDEKTKVHQEISMFSGLPIGTFLRSLWRKILRTNAFRPVIITLICLALILMPLQNEQIHSLTTIALLVGFFVVGIPHGAVDHLLESKRWELKKMPIFILGYLAVGALMALIWFLFPSLGLMLFLAYSAWHFGQADGALWKFNSITSLFWGMSVLVILLGTHLEETNEILSAMGTIAMNIDIPWWAFTPWTVWFLLKKQMAGAITTGWIMLSCQLPLPIAFGIYFIGQHSLTGWKHIREHLHMSNTSIWMHSLPFHAGAWILMAVFYLAKPNCEINSSSAWGTFFVFLACLSLPHVLAMNKVYRSQGANRIP